MPDEVPLPSVSSEANRELEESIVTNTIRLAVKTAHHRDTNDPFPIPIVGIGNHPEFFAQSVHDLLVSHIEEQAIAVGLRVSHSFASSCMFYLHDTSKLP